MNKNGIQITHNGIDLILHMGNENKEKDVDIYLQLIDSKLINSGNLYICKFKDDKTLLDTFLIESLNQIENNSIIHITKLKKSLFLNNIIIYCINYQILGKIEKGKEKEIKISAPPNNKILEKISKKQLNEMTKKILNDFNLKHKKIIKRFYFQKDKERFFLVDKNKNEVFFNREKEDKIIKKNKEIDNNENEIDIKKGDNNDEIIEDYDEKEVEHNFKEINLIEFINNLNLQNKNNAQLILNQNYQLISDIKVFSKSLPIYVKCIIKNFDDTRDRKFLTCILRDEEGNEINAYSYGNDIEFFGKLIEENKIYFISNYEVKEKVNSDFIKTDYRLVFSKGTKIETMPQNPKFNKISFDFIRIDELIYFKELTFVDICGIIYDGGSPFLKKTKFGNKLTRSILLGDTSKKKVYLDLWETKVQNERIKYDVGTILAVKYCKITINPYKTKRLHGSVFTILQNSTSDYEKDNELLKFYENNKNIDDFSFVLAPLNYMNLAEINEKYTNNDGKENIEFITKAYLYEINFNKNIFYYGCPICRKKLDNQNKNIEHKCSKCKNWISSRPIYKLRVQFKDLTDIIYFSFLGDLGDKLIEVKSSLMIQYIENKNYNEINKIKKRLLNEEYIIFGNIKRCEYSNKLEVKNIEKAKGENLKYLLEMKKEYIV